MAMQRPRDIDDFRVRLLKHCDRKGFAMKAEYAKPVGGQSIRGPSIRFVETALQEYGNANPAAVVVYDDDNKRTMRVTMTEYERNVTWDLDVTVEKFVERKNPKDGEIVGQRQNSRGEIVYRVRATEDDLNNKLMSAVSKASRTLGLRILPADIVEEAMDVCRETRAKADKENPDAARHQIVDAFAQLSVTPANLTEYMGTPIGQASPVDIDELRVVYTSIRDGEARWADLLEAKRAERNDTSPSKPAASAAGKIREKIAARNAKPEGGQ
jgi:hypothetical protein